MKAKNNKGFIGIDIIISIIAIVLFSSLILALILNNSLKNVKLAKEAQATIYLTQTLENIGISKYINVSEYNSNKNYNNCIPSDLKNGYKITIDIPEKIGEKDIIQKITAHIEYSIGNKKYKQTMLRTKIKE
jgi:type II secretory pathway pseudopilin PulG